MRSRLVLLACGVVSPLLYLTGDMVASIRYDDYSYLHQTISELNAIGSPTRGLTIGFGIAVYLALIAFSLGLWTSTERSRRLRLVASLLFALGVVSLWAVPFASMRTRGAQQGPAHIIEGAVAVTLILASIGIGATCFGRRFRRYSIATMLVLLAFGVWAGIDGPRIALGMSTPWVGVKERISVYSYQLWFVALAVTLLRRPVQPRASQQAQGADGASPQRWQ